MLGQKYSVLIVLNHIDSGILFHDGYLRIGNGILTTKLELSTAAGEVRSAIDATHHPKVIRE